MERKLIGDRERLSKSILWSLMERLYESSGVQAWTDVRTPSYITSNTKTASAYAHIVSGFIEQALRPNAALAINKDSPLYIFDIGAGTGRFAYLFLHYFLPLVPQGVRIKYVMTDIAMRNLEFWKRHPKLQRYIVEGTLDMCLYHADQSDPGLFLEIQRSMLLPDTMQNPVIFIANYLFDTVKHDLFLASKGALLEGHISVSVPDNGIDPLDPKQIPHIEHVVSGTEIEDPAHYYPNKDWNTVLESYRKEEEGELEFTFPIGALQVIDYFRMLSNNRLFFIGADQGAPSVETLRKNRLGLFSLHGSFSVPVNYDAIGRYISLLNGCYKTLARPDIVFNVFTGCIGGQAASIAASALAYSLYLEPTTPSVYVYFFNALKNSAMLPSLAMLISFLRFSKCDPYSIHLLFSSLREQLATDPSLWPALTRILIETREHMYCVTPEEAALLMDIGCLFFDMQEYGEAKRSFEEAFEVNPALPGLKENLLAVGAAKQWRNN